MKRLILIQNDYSGAGKTTLAQCFDHYLNMHRVSHHNAVLTETMDINRTRSQMDADALKLPVFIGLLDQSDLLILEIESGMTDLFYSFYEKHELANLLPEMGWDMTIVLPVTSEDESFDAASTAAEVFSDCAQYFVVHTPTSSFYDDESLTWERSHAARVMDMFEAVDMNMPPASDALEYQLKIRHVELFEAIQVTDQDPVLHTEIAKWFRKVSAQLEAAKKYVFGDSFRPEIRVLPAKELTRKTRGRKPKGAMALMQALADAA
jgi:hypothetical protein